MTVRPTLLYIAAFMLTMTSHEVAHALTANMLGFGVTLFPLWVTPDAAHATPTQIAIIAASGPIFSLLMGIASWAQYGRRPATASALVFLLLGIIGIYTFLGPLVGAAFGGDAHTALGAIGVPSVALYAVSAAGAVSLAVFMFNSGARLVRAVPIGPSRWRTVVVAAVAPWLIGTALSVVFYLPLPPPLIFPTLIGSVFWLFALLGATVARDVAAHHHGYGVRYSDVALILMAVFIVRLLAHGVRLAS